jgi:hypothetical protein
MSASSKPQVFAVASEHFNTFPIGISRASGFCNADRRPAGSNFAEEFTFYWKNNGKLPNRVALLLSRFK